MLRCTAEEVRQGLGVQLVLLDRTGTKHHRDQGLEIKSAAIKVKSGQILSNVDEN